jgi:hypothetical protein
MDLSLYLARAWGLGLVLLSLALLFNLERYLHMIRQVEGDDLTILVAGSVALILGVVQVAGYNVWTLDYRGLLTLLGWVSLVKGIAILFVPGYLARFATIVAQRNRYGAVAVIFLLIGIYLLYVGLTG